MSQTNDLYNTNGVSVSNGVQPNAGKIYNFIVTLVGVPVAFDLKPLVNQNRMDNVQGIFIDNSNGTSGIVVSTSTGQAIKIPAGFQAVMPIYLSSDKVITFVGNGIIPITLLNFASPACVWDVTGGASGDIVVIDGLAQVQDPALEALISGGGLNVNVLSGGGGAPVTGYGPNDAILFERVRNSWAQGYLQSGNDVVFNGGGPGSWMDSFTADLSADATLTGGGIIDWNLWATVSGSPNVFQGSVYVPATAPVVSQRISLISLTGMKLTSPGGNGFRFGINTNFTTGGIYWTAMGGPTNVN